MTCHDMSYIFFDKWTIIKVVERVFGRDLVRGARHDGSGPARKVGPAGRRLVVHVGRAVELLCQTEMEGRHIVVHTGDELEDAVARLLGALQGLRGAVEREEGLRDARARVHVQCQRPKS